MCPKAVRLFMQRSFCGFLNSTISEMRSNAASEQRMLKISLREKIQNLLLFKIVPAVAGLATFTFITCSSFICTIKPTNTETYNIKKRTEKHKGNNIDNGKW